MGLFSKTACSICGANAGIGSKTIMDGCICGKCRAKCSPKLTHYNNMNADEVREHIKYMEKNLADLKLFHPTKVLLAARTEDEDVFGGQIYIDESRRQFLVSEDKNYIAKNVLLYDYSDFKSFNYSPDNGYIVMKLMAYSKACNSIDEHEFEWDLDIPEAYKKKPQESPEFKEGMSIVQEIERFFNSMVDNTIRSACVNVVNIRCPNCGAMTAVTGQADNCKFCGATIANTFYKN